MNAIEKLLLTKYALSAIAAFLGSSVLILCIWALKHLDAYQKFLKDLPRNQTWARWLLLVNVVWSAPLTANFLQSMEFPSWTRPAVYFFIAPAAFLLILFKVNQYLGARMVGWTMILLAKPVLYACLVRDEPGKFVLVVLAYLWIIMGMLIIAAPHFYRDFIQLYLDRPSLLRRSLKIKSAFGVLLIALALFAF
jgi:hypothetical protein